MSEHRSLLRKSFLLLLVLLLIAGWGGLRARHSLLMMDIAKMNTSKPWKMASLVLLTPDERRQIKDFTHDKHEDWDKFFTLASGISIQKIIDTQSQLEQQAANKPQ